MVDLDAFIEARVKYEALPPDAQAALGHRRKAYEEKTLAHALHRQSRWAGNLIATYMPDERAYYVKLVEHSKTALLLYPYHLSEVLVKGLHITPFDYYHSMMGDIMHAERSYDSLPNFTAADGVRLLGIGRNQYIAAMNQVRSKGTAGSSWVTNSLMNLRGKKKSMIKELLPNAPVDRLIGYWWRVTCGFVSEEDVEQSNDSERSVIDILLLRGPQLAGTLPYLAVHSLYSRRLVYLDVPVDMGAKITIPPLEGFVMNRVSGDFWERLMYKLFVSLDESTSVADLASVLDIESTVVRDAVSMFARLGFVRIKGLEPLNASSPTGWHPSWVTRGSNNTGAESVSSSLASALIAATSPSRPVVQGRADKDDKTGSAGAVGDVEGVPASPASAWTSGEAVATGGGDGDGKRLGFLFDSTLTAFLMMGNLAPGLKAHAVTLFEVGKVSDEGLDVFLSELDTVDTDSGQDEGEALRFFEHAIVLRGVLRALRPVRGKLDLIRIESLSELDDGTRTRILAKNYNTMVSVAPLSTDAPMTSGAGAPPHYGPFARAMTSPWWKLYMYSVAGSGPVSVMFRKGERVRRVPGELQGFDRVLMCSWEREPVETSVANLLAQLNDALLTSPVLVQGAWPEAEMEYADVAFPLASTVTGDIPKDLYQDEGNDAGWNKLVDRSEAAERSQELEELDVVRKLNDQLSLSSFLGYLRLGRPKDKPGVSWMPIEVHFGVPLADAGLARLVLSRGLAKGAFDSDALERLEEAGSEIGKNFWEWMSGHVDNGYPGEEEEEEEEGSKVKQSSKSSKKKQKWRQQKDELQGTVPYPTRRVVFSNSNFFIGAPMVTFHLLGAADCPRFAQVEQLGDFLKVNLPDIHLNKTLVDPEQWPVVLARRCIELGAMGHKTDSNNGPLVWCANGIVIGGLEQWIDWIQERYGEEVVAACRNNLEEEDVPSDGLTQVAEEETEGGEKGEEGFNGDGDHNSEGRDGREDGPLSPVFDEDEALRRKMQGWSSVESFGSDGSFASGDEVDDDDLAAAIASENMDQWVRDEETKALEAKKTSFASLSERQTRRLNALEAGAANWSEEEIVWKSIKRSLRAQQAALTVAQKILKKSDVWAADNDASKTDGVVLDHVTAGGTFVAGSLPTIGAASRRSVGFSDVVGVKEIHEPGSEEERAETPAIEEEESDEAKAEAEEARLAAVKAVQEAEAARDVARASQTASVMKLLISNEASFAELGSDRLKDVSEAWAKWESEYGSLWDGEEAEKEIVAGAGEVWRELTSRQHLAIRFNSLIDGLSKSNGALVEELKASMATAKSWRSAMRKWEDAVDAHAEAVDEARARLMAEEEDEDGVDEDEDEDVDDQSDEEGDEGAEKDADGGDGVKKSQGEEEEEEKPVELTLEERIAKAAGPAPVRPAKPEDQLDFPSIFAKLNELLFTIRAALKEVDANLKSGLVVISSTVRVRGTLSGKLGAAAAGVEGAMGAFVEKFPVHHEEAGTANAA